MPPPKRRKDIRGHHRVRVCYVEKTKIASQTSRILKWYNLVPFGPLLYISFSPGKAFRQLFEEKKLLLLGRKQLKLKKTY